MDTKLYIIGAITAIVLSIILTPIVKKVAFVLGVVDVPKDERKIHKKPIPLLGGIAIYISFVVALVLKKRSFNFRRSRYNIRSYCYSYRRIY